MTFDLTAKGFSLANARLCAGLAKQIYLPDFDSPGQTPLGLCIVDKATDMHALVTVLGGVAFVVIRGSHSMENWIEDFDAFHKSGKQFWLHKGFEDCADALWPAVLKALAQIDPHVPIVVVGHSLGAAVALILGFWLEAQNPPRLQAVYAFEPPKIGGAKFKAIFDDELGQKTFCVTHGADLVPWVPLGFGYRRVGQEIFFPSGAGIWFSNPTALFKLWSDKWEFFTEFMRLKAQHWIPWAAPASPLLADHPIDAVIARLDAAQQAVEDGAIADWGRSA